MFQQVALCGLVVSGPPIERSVMAQMIFQVDAFTSQPFAGNPAGVCILPELADERWMQAVAAEMNLSETAFLVPVEDGYNLRWYTPATEVDLCGHATLASAHILWEQGFLEPDQLARFHTRSGLLTAVRKGAWIEMDFPAEEASEIEPQPALEKALGLEPLYTGQNRFDVLIEIADEDAVRALAPNFEQLRSLAVRGVIVTAIAASPDYDFVSRFFAPAVGIDEDPVTGSAHCCLGPYWSTRFAKTELVAYQASARGGIVRMQVVGERVLLSGQAVTVFRAEFA
jgi:PhzF family phenazine biosynthesis protein